MAIETGDKLYGLPPGFGPVLVDKDGTVCQLGTGRSLEEMVKWYEALRGKNSDSKTENAP